MKGHIPYGIALAYLAMKKRGPDSPAYNAPNIKLVLRNDGKYCEPTWDALMLVRETMGQDLLELLDPIAKLVAGKLGALATAPALRVGLATSALC